MPDYTRVYTSSGASALVDSRVAANFQGFLQDLENQGYDINSLGGYNDRNISGTSKPSYHSLGDAIDINPGANAVGTGAGNLPSNIKEIADKWGLGWGGDWQSKNDPMHFSAAKYEGGAYDINRYTGAISNYDAVAGKYGNQKATAVASAAPAKSQTAMSYAPAPTANPMRTNTAANQAAANLATSRAQQTAKVSTPQGQVALADVPGRIGEAARSNALRQGLGAVFGAYNAAQQTAPLAREGKAFGSAIGTAMSGLFGAGQRMVSGWFGGQQPATKTTTAYARTPSGSGGSSGSSGGQSSDHSVPDWVPGGLSDVQQYEGGGSNGYETYIGNDSQGNQVTSYSTPQGDYSYYNTNNDNGEGGSDPGTYPYFDDSSGNSFWF